MSPAFPAIVYILCFLTSAACAWLLGRSYARSGVRLLLWSSICFGFLAANVVAASTGEPLFPAYSIENFSGARVGTQTLPHRATTGVPITIASVSWSLST